jgi:tetratricopeptide (TPR) repeat protein
MAVIDRERWNLLEPLLDQALDLTPEERAPWLEALSHSAPDVAAELAALLRGDASADRDGFLARPLEVTLEGLEVGAYTLERPLGHGGMGSVWLARRSDGRFEGNAAVKLLNLALVSALGQERFRREGSMLARLEHPGIARLLDAGVSRSGQPYLVIEFVDGQALDVYAKEHHLSQEECIRLALRVMEAVAHAHANLIVHRDLKPSNILVTKNGTVKLLDFGIAKLASAGVDGETAAAITLEGGGAFTPQFAAPEQIRGEPITTATDVYALGVILYLLLTGRHPTAPASASPADTVRAILDVEPTAIAPRDLDSVLRKALRKDTAQRYQTVETFADDLQRYLAHKPVKAVPDAFRYRAGKFVRRNRPAVTVALVAMSVLITATIVSIAQLHEANRQRDTAVAERRRADGQAELSSLLMSQIGDKPITLREILDRTSNAMEHQFAGDPAFLASALIQLGDHYGELGDSKVRGALLARAESIAVASHDSLRLIEVSCDKADNLRVEGKPEEADRMLKRADGMLRRFPDPNVEASCLLSRADLENETGNVDKSAPAIHRAITIRDSIGNTRDLFYIALLQDLAYTLDRQNRAREGTVVMQHAIALMDSTGRAGTTTSVEVRHDLGVMYGGLGETAAADTLLENVLRDMSRTDPGGRLPEQPLIHYAHIALYQGEADSARKYFAKLASQAVADHNTYWEGRALFGRAQAELMLGRVSDARKTIERFRAISGNKSLGRSDDQVVNINTLDALSALASSDTAHANRLIEQTLRDYGFFNGKRTRGTLHSTLMIAAGTALALHHTDSALVYIQDARAAATRDSLTQTRSARVGETWLLEAKADLQRGDRTAASAAASRAVTALRSGAGETNPRTREAEALMRQLSGSSS